jgi:Yip1-like protein
MARAQAIILRPRTEWAVIAAEPTTVSALYQGYAMWLAAIPSLATLIGSVVFLRSPIGSAVVSAIFSWAFALAGTYLIGMIVNTLAPSFGGTQDRVQAQKLCVYGSTPGWLAGIFGIVPALNILTLLGLYTLYLWWIGLPVLMKTPAERTLIYLIAIFIATIVVYAVIAAVVGGIVGAALVAY